MTVNLTFQRNPQRHRNFYARTPHWSFGASSGKDRDTPHPVRLVREGGESLRPSRHRPRAERAHQFRPDASLLIMWIHANIGEQRRKDAIRQTPTPRPRMNHTLPVHPPPTWTIRPDVVPRLCARTQPESGRHPSVQRGTTRIKRPLSVYREGMLNGPFDGCQSADASEGCTPQFSDLYHRNAIPIASSRRPTCCKSSCDLSQLYVMSLSLSLFSTSTASSSSSADRLGVETRNARAT